MTSRLKLRTLGGLDLGGPAGSLLPGRRVDLALLTVVAGRSPSAVRREELQALFWGERTEEKARHSLRQVVFRLRHACGDAFEADATTVRIHNGDIDLDTVRFGSTVAAGRYAEAIAVCPGEFLPDCEDIGTDDFRHWLEVERERIRRLLAQCYERAVDAAESCAEFAAAADLSAAWSERFPLDERAALHLVRSLARASRLVEAEGVRHVFELRLRRELDVAPSPSWLTDTAALLATPEPPAPPPAGVHPESSPAATPHNDRRPAADVVVAVARPSPRRLTGRTRALVAIGTVLVVVFAGIRVATARPGRAPTLAVGEITSALPADSARGFATLLAIDLARVPQIDVITDRRLSEFAAARRGDSRESVARAAGAREILEGVLSRRADNTLRIDLRRTDLATGTARSAYTIEARDLTELADLVTEQIAAELGARAAIRRAEGTTTSILAYRFYEQGLRAFYEGDPLAARRLLDAALSEDSTFAMAAYYAAIVDGGDKSGPRMEQARRHAARSSERERLLIDVAWAQRMADPRAMAWAESLVTRYPGDADGQVLYARELAAHQQIVPALEHFRRVVAMDSSLAATAIHCRACDAVDRMMDIYAALDSGTAAERDARLWLRWQPRSPRAWSALAGALSRRGQFAAAHIAVDSSLKFATDGTPLWHAVHWFAADDYAAIDRVWRGLASAGMPGLRGDALWTGVISLRTQGRGAEAVRTALAYRVESDANGGRDKPNVGTLFLQGTALFDAGEAARAAAVFDSAAMFEGGRLARALPARRGASLAWAWTHSAGAYAALRDTAALRRIEDSVRVHGMLSSERYQRLHHYVRGLRLALAGRHTDAATAFTRAVWGAQDTHARIYLELGRSLIAAGRPADAVAPLMRGLKGPVSAAGLYATRTELEEQLAIAYDKSGQPDLALAQYRKVARAWRNADPRFDTRRNAVQARVDALSHVRPRTA